MGHQVFLDLIKCINTDPVAWEAAIKANPGEEARALRTAVFYLMNPHDVTEVDRFCQVVVNLAMRLRAVERAGWELCDDIYGSVNPGDGFIVDGMPEETKLKAHALLNALGDGIPW